MDSASQALFRVDFRFVAYPPGYHNNPQDVKIQKRTNLTLPIKRWTVQHKHFPVLTFPSWLTRQDITTIDGTLSPRTNLTLPVKRWTVQHKHFSVSTFPSWLTRQSLPATRAPSFVRRGRELARSDRELNGGGATLAPGFRRCAGILGCFTWFPGKSGESEEKWGDGR